MSWLGLVVCALAAYRLTRVVTTDVLTAQLRDRLYRWAWVEPDEGATYTSAWLRWHGDEPMGDMPTEAMPRRGALRTYISELFQCPWCLGVWVSFAVTAFWVWVVRDGVSVALYLVMACAVAGLQGFLASRQDA